MTMCAKHVVSVVVNTTLGVLGTLGKGSSACLFSPVLIFYAWQHGVHICRPMSNALMPMLLDHRAIFYKALF